MAHQLGADLYFHIARRVVTDYNLMKSARYRKQARLNCKS